LLFYNARMKNKEGKTKELNPAWWVAYGVLCGLGAAGLILMLASRPRGQAIALVAAPTRQVIATSTAPAETPTISATFTPTVTFPININTATVEELDQIPGIGPATAQNIVTYREAHGPFTSIHQVQNVPEIGPITFEAIAPFITVGESE
jgi:competence protein ComEA